MKKLIEILNTDNTDNVLNRLRLADVKIGQRFRFTKEGLIYIKDTEQGMNNQASAVHTVKEIKTKGYGYPKQRHSVRYQADFIYEILPDIIKKGGKRKGAGAKPKYNEQTKTVAFRCPLSKVDELKLIVKSKLSEWSVK
jgi:hypothetical protein